MKIAISAVSLLACAFSLDAQITTTLNRLSGRPAAEIRIRNGSAVSLTAVSITVSVISVGQTAGSATVNNAPLVVWYDSAIDLAAKPLLPNQERALPPTEIRCPVPIREKSRSGHDIVSGCELGQPIVTAGIFADGSTTGDAASLARLMLRRSNMLLAVETALETLFHAGRHNIPRDQLIGQFRRMVDSVRRWYLPPEQQIGLPLYNSMIGKLMNLPEGQAGSPFPPSTFVEQETAMLRQQRIKLLESEPSLADVAAQRMRTF